MIPSDVVKFLQANREEQGCLCFTIDKQLNIIHRYGDIESWNIEKVNVGDSIFSAFPFLVTESFDNDFEIPFFNINDDHVCNIYFYITNKNKYIILVDKSEIFQITRKYQQYAHDDNISKNKFKRLAEELERAKQKLDESNKQKATLIAVLSHELGTPLTSILGYSELLKNKNVDSNKAANIIHRNANDLMMMIENTLQFGRSEANDQEPNYTQCDILDFFEDLKSTLNPIIKNNDLELVLGNQESETIILDYAKVKQILINLLSNAVKYTEQGSVHLSFSNKNNSYKFTVKDTGIGIPKKHQELIFNSWQRVDEKETKGAGIGLIISQNLAHSMKGRVALIESIPNQGSTFELKIPAPSQVVQEEKAEPSVIDANGKSILILDDDFDVLELLEMMLSPLNLNVVRFQKIHDAIQHLSTTPVDIILSDYHIGHESASDFVKELKAIKLESKILLMTAMPSESLKRNYKSKGFEQIISKPIKQKELIEAIQLTLKQND